MLKKLDKPKVKLDGSILGNVDHYKYLGVILDSTLNLIKHINNIIKTVSHKLNLLSKTRQFITQAASVRLQFRDSTVCGLWGCCLSGSCFGSIMQTAGTSEQGSEDNYQV